MPISQTEDYFENALYRFLEEPVLFLLASKMKAFSSVQTKTNPNSAANLAGRSSNSFFLSLMNHIFQTPVPLIRGNKMYNRT